MLKVVDLPVPKPDSDLIESMKDLLDQAERAEFVACVVVKIREDGKFQCHKYGVISDLKTVGALSFAKHDIMNANTPDWGDD